MAQENNEQQRKAAIRQTFDSVADAYGHGGCRFFHSAGQTMATLHALNGDEQILDVASGTGAVAIPLAQRLRRGRVTAIDFSTGMLAQAEARAVSQGLRNVDFRVADMTALPFPDHHFDHANCAFGLFFVDDMAGLLRHITSKVRPGGRVMISGFCGDSFMPQATLALDRLRRYGIAVPEQPFGWKRMAEPEQLHALLDAAGLTDIQIVNKSLGYYITSEGWWDVMWNAGFRGLVAQLGDRLDDYRREHLAEIDTLKTANGMWLQVDVHYTSGLRP
ncbi:MAG: methyltransferase domain-containing protein [Gammaproteobacteria bacterium]|nr:methyltransferase domain-containing protein [Gammaproteobacteria bacterium]